MVRQKTGEGRGMPAKQEGKSGEECAEASQGRQSRRAKPCSKISGVLNLDAVVSRACLPSFARRSKGSPRHVTPEASNAMEAPSAHSTALQKGVSGAGGCHSHRGRLDHKDLGLELSSLWHAPLISFFFVGDVFPLSPLLLRLATKAWPGEM